MTYIGIVNDDYLEHHGVKGMKWGVRKKQPIKAGLYKGKAIGKNDIVRRHGTYFVYQNKKGKNKVMRLSSGDLAYMKKQGHLDRYGRLKSGHANQAQKAVRFYRGMKRAINGAVFTAGMAKVGNDITVNGKTVNSWIASGAKNSIKRAPDYIKNAKYRRRNRGWDMGLA